MSWLGSGLCRPDTALRRAGFFQGCLRRLRGILNFPRNPGRVKVGVERGYWLLRFDASYAYPPAFPKLVHPSYCLEGRHRCLLSKVDSGRGGSWLGSRPTSLLTGGCAWG